MCFCNYRVFKTLFLTRYRSTYGLFKIVLYGTLYCTVHNSRTIYIFHNSVMYNKTYWETYFQTRVLEKVKS